MSALVRELVPFLWAHGAVLLILTFVPALGTWLLHVLGFSGERPACPLERSMTRSTSARWSTKR